MSFYINLLKQIALMFIVKKILLKYNIILYRYSVNTWKWLFFFICTIFWDNNGKNNSIKSMLKFYICICPKIFISSIATRKYL